MKALIIERLQLMTNGRLNRGVFAPKGAFQNVGFYKKKEVLFIRKIYVVRSKQMRSIAHACTRAHSTAQYSHGATMKAMVLGLHGDLECT
jgi:hypothetical protein